MKYLIFTLPIFISGCIYQSVDNVDIQKAIQFCGGYTSIEYIHSTAFGDETVKCSNKQKDHFLQDVLLP